MRKWAKVFKVGELIKRKQISPSAKGYCIVLESDGDNYTLYNNSLKSIQKVMCSVVENMYDLFEVKQC